MPDIFISPSDGKKEKKFTPIVKDNSVKKTSWLDGFNFSKQLFSSYIFMPDGIHFETQSPGEPIILLLRKHWITNIVWVATGILLIIMPIFLFPLIIMSGIIPANTQASLVSFAILVWYLFTFSYILVNFLFWYFSVSIVTTERIVDVDFFSLLYKKFAETRISKIEDVTNQSSGFISSLFQYGDVIVQTAAKDAMFEFGSVPYPEQIVKIINELMEKSADKGGHQ